LCKKYFCCYFLRKQSSTSFAFFLLSQKTFNFILKYIFIVHDKTSHLMLLQAYVIFVQMLGGTWLERNIGALIAHVLDLVTNPKAASSHVEAVYSRKCVNFILRGTIGKLLGEGAQAAACKEIAHIILKQMNSIGKIFSSHFNVMYSHI